MKAIEYLHGWRIESRRVEILAGHLAQLASDDSRLLDVGCGDGQIARRLLSLRRDVRCTGVDVQVRPACTIAATRFDGSKLPFGDGAFDTVLLIDVLHHSNDARSLLRECARVSRRSILLKDHTLEGPLAGMRLRFMDRVGNARHGVALPYAYWSRSQWRSVLTDLMLPVEVWRDDLGLYPRPLRWLFESSLHFVARLDTRGVAR